MFNEKLAVTLAELSKLSFTEEELKKITTEMDEIITLMDTVSTFESDGITEDNSAVRLTQIREDIKKDSTSRSDILKNAAKREEKAFTVPKVV